MQEEIIRIRRSSRRSLSVEIKKDGSIIVRAPFTCSDDEIRRFLLRHQKWILQKKALIAQAQKNRIVITSQMRLAGIQKARAVFPAKAALYAKRMGVTYGRITIREQKTRWGSCSSKGNLNFNCLLMLCPREVIDSVVVHELAHRIEMNHSGRFYEIVLHAFPDYWTCDSWLKENGPVLLKRMIM